MNSILGKDITEECIGDLVEVYAPITLGYISKGYVIPSINGKYAVLEGKFIFDIMDSDVIVFLE